MCKSWGGGKGGFKSSAIVRAPVCVCVCARVCVCVYVCVCVFVCAHISVYLDHQKTCKQVDHHSCISYTCSCLVVLLLEVWRIACVFKWQGLWNNQGKISFAGTCLIATFVGAPLRIWKVCVCVCVFACVCVRKREREREEERERERECVCACVCVCVCVCQIQQF